ncbi:MAG: amidohydrolase family protein [Caldithrix sp.]|nr:amidohydrolase family protein [Caldithrix sp.]
MHSKMTRRTFNRTLAAGTLGILTGCNLNNRFDIILRNGLIVDGSGSAPLRQDVGIMDQTIHTIGDLSQASAKTVIDCRDKIICPGFIDIHTHTDMELLVNARGESKIRQGVTTEVGGNCGSSPFPLNDIDFKDLDEHLYNKYGLHTHWHDTAGFLQALEDNKIALNYVTLTGHGKLRSSAVGKNDVKVTADQLKSMQYALQKSMEEGSFGLSTGLEYAPGSYASTEELIALSKVVATNNGLYATHMRNEDDRVEEAIEEALQICAHSGVSLQISHLKACNQKNWHKVDHMLRMIHEAEKSGMPVAADRYPYTAYGTGLSVFLPITTRQGTTDDILNRLSDPKLLPEIKSYAEYRGRRIGGWDRVLISSCATEPNKELEGKTILAASKQKGIEPFEFIRNLLIEERNRVSIVGFAMSEENLQKVLSSPLVMVGSDGNAVANYGPLADGKPHPRFYGTFPRVLGKYSRDAHWFDLPTAVRKMTSMPAQKLGLPKRGLLSKGYYADVVVFDPQTVIDNATFTEPHQYPGGIEYVIVNGTITVQQSQHTGAMAGSVIRRV